VGRDFRANLIILDSKGIDVILGMGWLTACDAVIRCAKRSILLTSPAGDRFEFAADPAPSNASAVNKLGRAALEDIRVVCDYPDVFPEELPGMPPDRDVEFVIEAFTCMPSEKMALTCVPLKSSFAPVYHCLKLL
jgi:hypothetical protein